jgi:YD repeat-containing protein
MKFFLPVILLFCLYCTGYAQTASRKIIKITETGKPTIEYLYDKKNRLITVKENGQVEKSIQYDTAGHVKLIRYYEKKKLNYTDSAFAYNPNGKPVSFTRIFPGYSIDNVSFNYDNQNRVTKRRIDKNPLQAKKDAAPRWEERIYSYNGNTITEEQKATSFGGVIGYKHVYEFDTKGNMIRLKETMAQSDTPEQIISGYDDHPRIQLPDEWIDHPLPRSANNPGRYQWNEKLYETFIYTYTPDGLVNGYTYFYQGNDLSLTRKIKITYSK